MKIVTVNDLNGVRPRGFSGVVYELEKSGKLDLLYTRNRRHTEVLP